MRKKWKAIAPAHLAQYRATRKDKKAWDKMQLGMHTCTRCKTVYRHGRYVDDCEGEHRKNRANAERRYASLVKEAANNNAAAKRFLNMWKWEE
jgi:hypothetical protein